MRLWSLHPSYLDTKGLLAVWREGLLAKKVLEGSTKGYKNHPQLERFKDWNDPSAAIEMYLQEIVREALHREYKFSADKAGTKTISASLIVTNGQLEYEFEHLLAKLETRSPKDFIRLSKSGKNTLEPHPIFTIVTGPIAAWERL